MKDQLTVSTCRGAAVGVVTKYMDVHATLGIGIVARNVPSDGSWARFRVLFEGNSALDGGVTTNDAN